MTVDFITQLTTHGQAAHFGIDQTNVHLTTLHKLEGFVAHIFVTQFLHHLAGIRAGDGETNHGVGHIRNGHITF